MKYATLLTGVIRLRDYYLSLIMKLWTQLFIFVDFF